MERYKSVKAGNVILGDGIPKICVPIVAKTKEAALEEAKALTALPADLAEWRLDCLEDPWEASEILLGLKAVLGEVPLLVTFRTKAEGGNREFSKEDYLKLNQRMLTAGGMELLDVELFTGELEVRCLIEAAHQAGVQIVMSSHDFARTPEQEEMLQRLLKMQELGADITKLAVMPRNYEDVTRLFAVSTAMRERYADRPFITMSMGDLGLASRVCGSLTGSALTFGSAAEASAPGQMKAEVLSEVLKALQTEKKG